ncbi:hypothetical protein BJ138DRAFT_151546 [Hygrophoropsis aurantiaca]|uniref:Uncharacterized protein n=1 Tax=Hygrophoropsis aurantiaca TaxID=72124 RepID=A0ACB8A9Z4_9AGAM|nr:hypothetical protein BJ138DRAFT_151546 [Hygrophoropsis aurantiaca]
MRSTRGLFLDSAFLSLVLLFFPFLSTASLEHSFHKFALIDHNHQHMILILLILPRSCIHSFNYITLRPSQARELLEPLYVCVCPSGSTFLSKSPRYPTSMAIYNAFFVYFRVIEFTAPD